MHTAATAAPVSRAGWDRRISGHQVLVLLANVDLIFDKAGHEMPEQLLCRKMREGAL